jgi:hypothetical protein
MTVPTNPEISLDNPNRNHTSAVYVQGRPLVTFQMTFDNFSGNVKPQGSNTQLGPWYDIGSQRQYINQEERDHWNVSKATITMCVLKSTNMVTKPRLAMWFVSGGAVTNVALNNQGSQWLSTPFPNIDISRRRYRCHCLCHCISSGSISGAVVVTGGEGYVNNPNAAVNNGFITSIAFR